MNHRLVLIALGLMAALGLLLTGCSKSGGPATGQAKYHCPMHPTYVRDRPGDCPICNMKLVPIKEGAPNAAPSKLNQGAHVKVGQFYCPMDINVVSNAPGICPVCEMNLVEKKAGAEEQATPPGRAAVLISPEKQQLIGLRLATVTARELTNSLRATGTVQHDETRLARISPRFNGWVWTLNLNYIGQHVEKDDALMTVYSPDLLAAENEYLLTFRQAEMLKAKPGAPEFETARRLLESARRRLELWQIGDSEIRELEQTRQARDELLVRSPVSGHVITKNAVEGKAFMAGETLFEIGELDPLWLRVAVNEQDFPLIRTGQTARVTFPYRQNETHDSKVTFLYPHIDPQTRRGEVRLELPNPNHQLRPDMWANVEIQLPLGTVLAVPASAVIDTGRRTLVFVKRADDHFEPREVRIGARVDDYWQVLDGVKDGEQVVTRALFLVDSESQLKAAIAGMAGGGEHQH